MNRWIFVGSSLLLATLCITPVKGTSTPPSTQPSLAEQNQQLKDQVKKLQDEVKDLRKQLDEAKRGKSREFYIPRTPVPTPGPEEMKPLLPRITPSVPRENNRRDWIPKEFNGSTYYIVPLKSE
jgi:hypothetical protein